MKALKIKGLSKRFGRSKALCNVSLEVYASEFFTLLGPSGAGKSTLLNCVAGLEEPDAGTIKIAGQDVTSWPANRRGVGMVFQDSGLFPSMPAAENVAFPLIAKTRRSIVDIVLSPFIRREDAREIDDRVRKFLEIVELSAHHDKRPHQLSGGEQQRVALARALVFQPRLLCMDEPLSSLDKNLRREMQAELRALQGKFRMTTLYVTHDQAEAFTLSDRIGIINAGRIEQVGTARELYDHPESEFVASFLGDCNRLEIEGFERTGDEFFLRLRGGLRLLSSCRPESVGDSIGIRPEKLQLALDGPDSQMSYPARVLSTTFVGSQIRVALEIGAGVRLTALTSSARSGDQLAPGNEIYIGCRSEDIIWFPGTTRVPLTAVDSQGDET